MPPEHRSDTAPADTLWESAGDGKIDCGLFHEMHDTLRTSSAWARSSKGTFNAAVEHGNAQ
ncbi:MAG TPA: hypothetical protein VGD37_06095 [Kofleriaceae bacterium]|jgi:hypothetical protein